MHDRFIEEQRKFMESPYDIKLLRIRPITIEDVDDTYLKWLHDTDVIRYLSLRSITKEQALEHVKTRINSNTSTMFIIEYDKEKIGTATIYNYDVTDRVVYIGMMIGEKKYWGYGFGKVVTRLLIDYSVEKYNVNKLRLVVDADNMRARRCYEVNGFKITGYYMEKRFDE